MIVRVIRNIQHIRVSIVRRMTRSRRNLRINNIREDLPDDLQVSEVSQLGADGS